jgi:prepilin-type processing-associated H-X9-DG protein
LAILNYETTKKLLPPAYVPNYTGKQYYGPCSGSSAPSTSKMNPSNQATYPDEHFILTFILPYLEQQAIFDSIDLKKNYDHPINRPYTRQDISDFICPSAPSRNNVYATDYTTLVDISDDDYCADIEAVPGLSSTKRPVEKLVGMLEDIPVQIRKVSDGLSKTFLFFESAGKPGNFVKGVPTTPDVPATEYRWASRAAYGLWGNAFGSPPVCGITTVMNCDNYSEIYSFHPGGAIFLFGDGSADFIGEDVNVDTFISLFTRAAEDVPGPLN